MKANRSKKGHGDWIGSTSLWNHPKAQIERTPTMISYDDDFGTITDFEDHDYGPSKDLPEPRGFATPSIRSDDPRPASKPQLKFLKDLFAQRSQSPEAQALRLGALSVYKAGNLSVTAASDFITVVKRIPRDSN